MKIVCGSCGAKYSIADDKVAGKVFKIRCKRCSEVIVVQGDQGSAEMDNIWHVVVNGEQKGPVSPTDLANMLSSGTIDWEAFVWAEGFDNWVPLRDVEQLVSEISGSAAGQISDEELTVAQSGPGSFGRNAHEEPTVAQTSTATGGYSAAAALAGAPQMGADPFAASPRSAASPGAGFGAGSFGSASMSGGGAAAAPLAGGGAASTGPRVSAQQAMTGARNENSVLFSLKNLQALATTSSTPSLRPGPSMGGAAPGFASGEGSGLIDIRALASATGSGPQADRPATQKDDLLSLGGQAGGLGALASPMMAAPATERDGDSKMLLVASILGGAVLVAGAVIAFAMISRPEAQPAAAVAPVAPLAPVAPAAVAPVAAVAAAAAPSATDQSAASAEEKSHGDREASEPAKRATKGKSKSSSGGGSSAKAAAADPDPIADAPAPKPKPRGGSASLDELLEGAVGGGGKSSSSAKAAAPAAASNLPEKPGRDDVLNAMNGVKDDVSACANGAGGTAIVNISVKGSTGKVTAAQVEGQTGAVGSCIAKAVRKATFPKFSTDVFKVKFPFRL